MRSQTHHLTRLCCLVFALCLMALSLAGCGKNLGKPYVKLGNESLTVNMYELYLSRMKGRLSAYGYPVDIPEFWNFSRIPVYEDDKENIVGWVLRRDVFRQLDEDRGAMKLREVMKPIHFILESVTLDKVLSELLNRHQHIFAVLDEYGGLAGVITLEDVLEELIGRDIVDESDVAEDLRSLARQRRAAVMQEREKKADSPALA